MSSAIPYFLSVLLLFFLAACDPTPRQVVRGEVVNLYSNCLTASDKALFTPFETASGLKVNIISEADTPLFERIRRQGNDSTNADVLILRGTASLYRAKQTDILDTLPSSSFLSTIPVYLRDEEDSWLTLGYSAFAMAYRRDSLDDLQVQRYAQLADEKWKGRVVLPRQDDSFYLSLLAALMADTGEETASDWWRALYEAHQTEADSLSLLQLINTSTYGSEPEWALRFPQPETYLQLTGVSIRKNAPHPDRAAALFNYLFSREYMRRFAERHQLYPSRPDVDAPAALPAPGQFQPDTTARARIARLTENARTLLNRRGEELTP